MIQDVSEVNAAPEKRIRTLQQIRRSVPHGREYEYRSSSYFEDHCNILTWSPNACRPMDDRLYPFGNRFGNPRKNQGLADHQGYSGSMIREFVRPTYEVQKTTKCTYRASSTSPLDRIPSAYRQAKWLHIWYWLCVVWWLHSNLIIWLRDAVIRIKSSTHTKTACTPWLGNTIPNCSTDLMSNWR